MKLINNWKKKLKTSDRDQKSEHSGLLCNEQLFCLLRAKEIKQVELFPLMTVSCEFKDCR